MDENVVTDLKQFIAGAITQQTSDIRQDIQQLDNRISNLDAQVNGLDEKVNGLSQKVDDGFLAIAEILENSTNSIDAIAIQVEEHDTRLARLEQRPN